VRRIGGKDGARGIQGEGSRAEVATYLAGERVSMRGGDVPAIGCRVLVVEGEGSMPGGCGPIRRAPHRSLGAHGDPSRKFPKNTSRAYSTSGPERHLVGLTLWGRCGYDTQVGKEAS
jgi:hypothetical protein